MTYCTGMLLDAGLVFLSDSRTNAGVDQISSFRKVSVYERTGKRVLVLLSAGNLAITQSVTSLLREHCEADSDVNLDSVPNLFEAARHVGEQLREVYRRDAAAMRDQGVDFSASLILGGQILGEPPRLFCIYSAGNFIEATPETPYFQIGEAKYGKPILDRVVTRSTSIAQAAKCALISMDSTMRSNLSVGPPLDLVCVRRDALRVLSHVNIDMDSAYFRMVRGTWSEALREAFHALPDPEWLRQS
jgi:putative proteasome-type protease